MHEGEADVAEPGEQRVHVVLGQTAQHREPFHLLLPAFRTTAGQSDETQVRIASTNSLCVCVWANSVCVCVCVCVCCVLCVVCVLCVCVSHQFSELMRVRLCVMASSGLGKGWGPGGSRWGPLREPWAGSSAHTRLKNKRRSQLDAGALPGSRDNITDVF